MKLIIGNLVTIQGYKHDHTLHRIWQESKVLDDNEEYIVVANKRTKVIEANGRFWFTKEPSVTFFYKQHWYNVIGIIKPTGITYYCNLCSPILVDDEALKYIDYDLDVKVSEDRKILLMDHNEYLRHIKQMDYPSELCQILEAELAYLQNQIKTGMDPFVSETITNWYQKYLQL
ncbi:MAG: DUF402 domain-containing protein [Candidatus Izemoplasmatales bacterium]|jgi:hypothetical protein|nr:DUF402 domain-containing protein [Candidatus Izemoplasmatales bacterium]MDD4595782.1 DUF402 domain-containing protein [Candidatus Izemoplasmatales bacterium]